MEREGHRIETLEAEVNKNGSPNKRTQTPEHKVELGTKLRAKALFGLPGPKSHPVLDHSREKELCQPCVVNGATRTPADRQCAGQVIQKETPRSIGKMTGKDPSPRKIRPG